jgi:plastocyanin
MTRTGLYTRRAAGAFAVATLLLFAQGASAQDVTIDLTVQGKKFQPNEVRAPANKPILFRVKNRDAASVEFESKSMRVEKVIPANGEGTIRVRALKAGRYEFFDDFNESNRGTLIVE